MKQKRLRHLIFNACPLLNMHVLKSLKILGHVTQCRLCLSQLFPTLIWFCTPCTFTTCLRSPEVSSELPLSPCRSHLPRFGARQRTAAAKPGSAVLGAAVGSKGWLVVQAGEDNCSLEASRHERQRSSFQKCPLLSQPLIAFFWHCTPWEKKRKPLSCRPDWIIPCLLQMQMPSNSLIIDSSPVLSEAPRLPAAVGQRDRCVKTDSSTCNDTAVNQAW